MKHLGLICLMLLTGCSSLSPAPEPSAQIPGSLVRQDFDLHFRIYIASIQSDVTVNWIRPANLPIGVVCKVHIVQIPGGQVVSAKVLPSCPFDDAGRESVKAAVERSSPLPYKGFEDVFKRDIIFNFTAEK
jgi:hypothetical protein